MKAALLERALPRERGAPGAPRRAASPPDAPPEAPSAARPGAPRPATRTSRSQRSRLGPSGPDDAARDVVPPVHGDGPHPARPPRAAASTRPHRGGRRRPGRVRHRARRRRDLHARVPRRARDAGADASGSPTASGRRPSPIARRTCRRKASPASRPTSTSCATASQRFGLLDDRVRFLQGPIGGDAARRADRDARAAAHRARARRARRATVLDAPVRPGRPSAASSSSTTARDRVVPQGASRRSAPTRHRRAARARRRLGGRVAQGRVRRRAAPRAAPTPVAARLVPPLAPPRPTDAIDLTVVVVFYNMRREAARTLHSLSRAYQEGIDDVSYEVIVVENGSDRGPEARRGRSSRASGPSSATSTSAPTPSRRPSIALNRGIRAGAADAFALMIDGAHVLTPGVLHFGLAGLATYAPAIVATQQWYVGPGQQGDAMDDGYDQAYEDRLFETIGWPHAGYRLFEIGHFVGDRDWLDGVWESNCMFVAARAARAGRRLRRELLDGRRRLRQPRALRAARVVARHHGRDDPRRGLVPPGPRRHDHQPARRRPSGGRGCSATASTTPSCAAGRSRARASRSTTSAGITSPAARRTKPRRLSAEVFARGAAAAEADGRPPTPTPVPDELDVGVHRGGVAQPAVGATRPGSAGASTTAPDRPARLPGDRSRRSGPTGSSRPAPATAGARCSSRRSASSSATAQVMSVGASTGRRPARSIRACATSTGRARTAPTPWPRCATSSATDARARRARLVRGPVQDAPRSSRPTRRSCRVGSYVVVDRHDRQRPPGLAGVRAGPGRGGQADPHPPRRVRRRPGDGEVLAHLQPRRVPEAGALRFERGPAGASWVTAHEPDRQSTATQCSRARPGCSSAGPQRPPSCSATRNPWCCAAPASRSGTRSRFRRRSPTPSSAWRPAYDASAETVRAEMLPVLERAVRRARALGR